MNTLSISDYLVKREQGQVDVLNTPFTIATQDDVVNVGCLLFDLRGYRGLTQGELAAQLSKYQSFIANTETPGREPKLSSIVPHLKAIGFRLVIEPDPAFKR